MMNYELFKDVIVERIMEYLPENFKDYKIEISITRKTNEEKDTLNLRSNKEGVAMVSPNIYLDDLYKIFQECQDLDALLLDVVDKIVHYTHQLNENQFDLDLKSKKHLIIMNLVNTEMNKTLLETVPHREVLDLSIIYRVLMSRDDSGFGTILINHDIMEELQLTEDQLHQLAYENTERLLPVKITKVTDVFFTLTNEYNVGGAAAMLYKHAAELLAEKAEGDFYVIPCSIHDVIAVPKKKANLKELVEMLARGNQVCAPGDAILSNSIYRYNQQKSSFQIAASYFTNQC